MALSYKDAAREHQLPSRKNTPPARTAPHQPILPPTAANSNVGANNPAEALFAALTAAVRSAIAPEIDRLFELLAAQPEAADYRDRYSEAKRLDVSVATLDRMCREGMPFVYVGDSRRFRAANVDAWLQARGKEVPP